MKKLITYISTFLLSISIIQPQTVPNLHKHLVQGYIKKSIPTYKRVVYKQLSIITLIASHYLSRFSKNIPSQHEDNIQQLLHQHKGDLQKILRTLSYNNRPKTLKSLIQRYPEINLNHQSPTTGETPLHYTTKKPAFDAFKVLIDHNALIHIDNNLGESTWDILTNPKNRSIIEKLYSYAWVQGGNHYVYRKPEGLYTTLPCRNLHAYSLPALLNNSSPKNILLIAPGIHLTTHHKSLYPRCFQEINGTSPSLAEIMTFYPYADFDIIDVLDIRTGIEKTKQQQANYDKVWQYCFKHSLQLVPYAKNIGENPNKLLNKSKRDNLDFKKIKTTFIHGNLLHVSLKDNHYDLINCLHLFTSNRTFLKEYTKWENMLGRLMNGLKKQGRLFIDDLSFIFVISAWLGIDPRQFEKLISGTSYLQNISKKYACSITCTPTNHDRLGIYFDNHTKHKLFQQNSNGQTLKDTSKFKEEISEQYIFILTKL